MAKILRPRRGTAATATSQLTGTNKLKSGEVFFEIPNGGSYGKSEGRIMMGDGNTDYSGLTAFIDPSKYVHIGSTADQTVDFTETSSTDNSTLLKNIISGVSIKNAFASMKNLLSNLNSSVTQLNNDIKHENFYQKIGNIKIVPVSYTLYFNNFQSYGLADQNNLKAYLSEDAVYKDRLFIFGSVADGLSDAHLQYIDFTSDSTIKDSQPVTLVTVYMNKVLTGQVRLNIVYVYKCN